MPMHLRSPEDEARLADVIAALIAFQRELDAQGLALAAIYLEHAVSELYLVLGRAGAFPSGGSISEPN